MTCLSDISRSMINLRIYPNHDLTVQTARGKINVRMIMETIHEYYEAGNITSLRLWDLRLADLGSLDHTQVVEIVKYSKSFDHLRVDGKTALLFGEDLGYGLGRMFSTNQEIEESKLNHQPFRDINEAIAWLQLEDVTLVKQLREGAV